jgi:ribonuclease P protein component, eubacterial
VKCTQSIKKNYQFGFVYNKGKSIANKYLVVYVIKNRKYIDTNCLGITVSKKVGKSVVRSKVTRLIKESYRLMEDDIIKGYDIVILARVSANMASFHEINRSVYSLLKKQGLIKSALTKNVETN